MGADHALVVRPREIVAAVVVIALASCLPLFFSKLFKHICCRVVLHQRLSTLLSNFLQLLLPPIGLPNFGMLSSSKHFVFLLVKELTVSPSELEGVTHATD